jgi:hypothetical protein
MFFRINIEYDRIKTTVCPGICGGQGGNNSVSMVQFAAGVERFLLDAHRIPDRQLGERKRTIMIGGTWATHNVLQLRGFSCKVITESTSEIMDLEFCSDAIDGPSVDLGIPGEVDDIVASSESSRGERDSGRGGK